jgi:GxxExxY protein
MEVHNELGPGFPEEYYQKALELEFANRQIPYEPQKPVQMLYKGTQIGLNYLDFVIDEKLILEIKSVNVLNEVHLFQTLKYLAVTKYPLALLVNFGKSRIEKKRVLPTMKMQEFRERER